MSNYITVNEAAELLSCTRGMIYALKKDNRIKFLKDPISGKITIDLDSLDKYLNGRWERKNTAKLDNGELVFKDDQITVKEAARLLNLSVDKVYYLAYSKKITCISISGHKVFSKEDVEAFKQKIEREKKLVFAKLAG